MLAALLLTLAVVPAMSQGQTLQKLINNSNATTPELAPAEGAEPGAPIEGAAPTLTLPSDLPVDPAGTSSADASEPGLADLKADAVNSATYAADVEQIKGASPLILKAQVLLDRAGASPGVIDSYYGDNVAKAIAAVEAVFGLPVDGRLDQQVWTALGGDNPAPVLVSYTITEADLAGPFVKEIPADYSKQAALKRLAYGGPKEMLAERFHMDVDLLSALNPGVDFDKAGSIIVVAAVDGPPIQRQVSRVEVNKTLKQVRAYDVYGQLVVAYPATIGSDDNPSPSGTHTIDKIVQEPFYNYDPKNFVQGDNHRKLTLPPGPNNPVGVVWIGLSEPGYGIHGTPQPSRIDKTGSHGCVRLTNWDAEELSNIVAPGVVVTFID